MSKPKLSRAKNEEKMVHLAKRFARAALVYSVLAVSATAAPPPNDNFADAIVLPPGPSVSTGTTVGATRQPGDPTSVNTGFGVSDRYTFGDNTVWWKWTSPSNYLVKFSTAGTNDISQLDTQLGVYTGPWIGALTEIASNDDRPYLGQGGSDVLISAVQGTTYYIAIAGYDSISGPVELYRSDVARPVLTIFRGLDHFIIKVMGERRASFTMQLSSDLIEWLDMDSFVMPDFLPFEYYVPKSHAQFYRTVIP